MGWLVDINYPYNNNNNINDFDLIITVEHELHYTQFSMKSKKHHHPE